MAMKLTELAGNWESLGDELKKCITEDFDYRGQILKNFFEKELAIQSEEIRKILRKLGWVHYPGFFPVKIDKYNSIFPDADIDMVKEDSFKKFITFTNGETETRMNPLLTFFYVHFQPPSDKKDEKTVADIQSIHKSEGNPAYLFWHLYYEDEQEFDRESTFFLSTLSLLYELHSSSNNYHNIMKELLFFSPEVMLTYYPWLGNWCDDLWNKIPIEKKPYRILFAIKDRLIKRVSVPPAILELLQILFNQFKNEDDAQAMLDAYRLFLIFSLNAYGFTNKKLIRTIQSMQEGLSNESIPDKIGDGGIEKEFLLMETNVINRFSVEKYDDANYYGLFKFLYEKNRIQHREILIVAVATLLTVSAKLRKHLDRWRKVVREKQPELWAQKICEGQTEIWQAIVLDDEQTIDELTLDICTGGELPSIPTFPEVKIFLETNSGEIIWQNHSIKLTKNDIKVLRAIKDNRKSPDVLRREIKLKRSALKKAIQRLKQKLKETPITLEFNAGKYVIVYNPEWEVNWRDKTKNSSNGCQ